MEEIVDEMQKRIEGELRVIENEPLFQGGDSQYLDLLLDISKGAELGFEHGASDARFLADHGIKGIVWGAEGEQTQHAPDEHINIESVEKLYRILEEYISRIV